jgi:hypothetical protein
VYRKARGVGLKIRITLLFILAFWSRSFRGLAVQAPPRGRIEGVVRNKSTNEPIPGALITLTRANPATGLSAGADGGTRLTVITGVTVPINSLITPPATNPNLPGNVPEIPTVRTDSRGQFVISDLESGAFRLSIESNGYVRHEYGQTNSSGRGALLTLSPDQMSKQITVLLTATGNVSGVMRDSSGNPVVGVPVQLVRRSYTASGQRVFQPVGSMRSNDRGEFRFYWESPGRYYLTAGNSMGQVGSLSVTAAVSMNDPRDTFLFTFYPGVTDPATASAIDIGPGDEIRVDFPLLRQETFRIRGRVVDGVTNRPPASIAVGMTSSTVTGVVANLTVTPPYDANTGIFEIRNLSAGSYWMTVASNGRVGGISLNVTNNIDGLAIVLVNSISLTGRISLDGRSDLTLPDRVRVQIRNMATGATSSEIASSDGTFRLENVSPGEYRVSISTDGNSVYYMKSARFGRNDVLGRSLVVADAAQSTPLDILISPSTARVQGAITDEQLRPVAGVDAVLIPEGNRDRTELFRTATTSPDGRFIINSVEPGDYKLFAWDALEPNGFFDLEFVKRYEQQGKPLHVGEGFVSNMDLRLIPTNR